LTLAAGVLPKRTWRCPPAPEKFCPVMVIVVPAGALGALRLVTTGVRSTTSKSLKWRLLSPWRVSWMSLSSKVRAKLLLASTE
jgi:hypothetical protein